MCLVAGQLGAECEVVPDVAMAGKEALVQINDGAQPAVHRFMVRMWMADPRECDTCRQDHGYAVRIRELIYLSEHLGSHKSY